MGNATGIIEVYGLVAAFVACDAGCKAADVTVEHFDKNKPGNPDSLTIPLIVGLGFEYIMYAGKHCNIFTKIFSAPGLWMQRITTREPDESQLAVAITAILDAIPAEFRDEVKAELTEAGEQPEESAPWVPAPKDGEDKTDSEETK